MLLCDVQGVAVEHAAGITDQLQLLGSNSTSGLSTEVHRNADGHGGNPVNFISTSSKYVYKV